MAGVTGEGGLEAVEAGRGGRGGKWSFGLGFIFPGHC